MKDEQIERVAEAIEGIMPLLDEYTHHVIAKAAIDAMQPQWQPIETAPKDGEEILVCEDDGTIHIARWYNGVEEKGWASDADFIIQSVTHFMPLPQPPE